ncbi:MAG TPA: hypothetical protein VF746_30120 [Longimicrobium sp.]|jgi:hypothetical protein
MTKKISAALCAAALAAALGGCGDSTGVAGSGDARMQVAAQGDDAPGASASRAPDGPRYSHSSASGTVDFRARVWVQTSAGGWVELTEQAAEQATVDASGHAGAVVFATSNVEVGAYSRVRVVFEDVRANVSGGIQVGTGLLTGSVLVSLGGDGSVTVERQVSVSASAGGTTRLLINLNSDVWLNQASATTHTVSETAFASAVQITAS